MSVKILHVCETANGGIATYLHLAEGNKPAHMQNLFLVPSSDAGILADLDNLRQFPSRRRGVRGLVAMLKALRRMLAQERPNVLFFHSTFALAGLAYARIAGWRGAAIYCPHGWAVSRYENLQSRQARLVRLIEGHLCGWADVVINISVTDQELARRLGYRGQHVTIENAVDPPSADARNDLFESEPDALHLLFVGRFDRQKGLDILLNAFRLASEQRPDLRLHIVGAAVREDGGEVDLPSGASLVGWVHKDRIDDWYRSADALVVPSRWEGFGLVAVEAMRNGTPVLCSDRGNLPTLITPGSTGEVFSADAEALASLLSQVDREVLQSYQAECRASFVKRFSVVRWGQEFETLLDSLTVEHAAETSREEVVDA